MNIILLTIVSAGGADFFNTFFKKFPFTLSWFGSNARINDGIPIVRTLVSVNCIGIKGYGLDVQGINQMTLEELLLRFLEEEFLVGTGSAKAEKKASKKA